MQLVAGRGEAWGRVDARAQDLLRRETDPRFTFQMLADWERAFGLPNSCVTRPQTLEERRTALLAKMTTLGGQSRAFFIAAATALGYAIRIVEWSPYQAGVSHCGDTRPHTGGGQFFRCSHRGAHAGQDHHLISSAPVVFTGPYRWRVGRGEPGLVAGAGRHQPALLVVPWRLGPARRRPPPHDLAGAPVVQGRPRRRQPRRPASPRSRHRRGPGVRVPALGASAHAPRLRLLEPADLRLLGAGLARNARSVPERPDHRSRGAFSP